MASTSSIDGLVSGMDTSGLVSQLMQLERRPVTLLNQRVAKEKARVAAYQGLNTKLAALQAAADDVAGAARWLGARAASSSTAVAASAGSGAIPGAYSFDVTQVATAQTYVTQAAHASTAARVTTATSLTITKGGGTPVTVQVGDGSMASVMAAVNASNAGVRATALQTGATSFKLVLTSTSTGAASAFTVTDGADLSPLGTLQQQVLGQDAMVGVGDPLQPGYVTVSSPTNSVADVVPGVTLTLSAPAAGVSVTVSRDTAAVADQVAIMVGNANGILAEIKSLTAYDAATKRAGLLTGDPVLREIERRVRDQVSSAVGATSPSTVGIQLKRDGTIAFDRDRFTAALVADPTGTARLFRPGASVTHPDGGYAALPGLVAFTAADDRTLPGSYAVKVTQAARQAMLRLTGAVAPGEDLTLTVPGRSPVHVVAAPGDGVPELAAKVNAASATAGLGLVATVAGGDLEIRTTTYGSVPTLSATTTGTLVVDPVVAGTDVAGSINGVAATGVGQALSAPANDPVLWGLTVLVSATAADVVTAAGQAGAASGLFGNLAYAPGIAQRLDSTAGDAIRSGTGRLTSLITGAEGRVDGLTAEIASYEQRLTIREESLRRQFSNLESALGKLKAQGTWLSGQLAGLSSQSSQQ